MVGTRCGCTEGNPGSVSGPAGISGKAAAAFVVGELTEAAAVWRHGVEIEGTGPVGGESDPVTGGRPGSAELDRVHGQKPVEVATVLSHEINLPVVVPRRIRPRLDAVPAALIGDPAAIGRQ